MVGEEGGGSELGKGRVQVPNIFGMNGKPEYLG